MPRIVAVLIANLVIALVAAAEPIGFEFTVGIGADWRYASDLVDTRVAPQAGIDIAVLRAAPPNDTPIWPIGLAIWERGDALGSSRGQVAVFGAGIVFSLFRSGAHDVRLTAGPTVITADRSGDGAYRHATAVGGGGALDYRWWWRRDEIAVGVRLSDDDALVGRGGVRRTIGAGALALILSERF